MNRIKNKFEYLKKHNKKAFGVFLTAGYPNLKLSENFFLKASKHGVDFFEIGIPFSDPMADGPLIQESSKKAIQNGVNVKKCFDMVSKIRIHNADTPIILMGYYNPIHFYGKTKFIKESIKIGVDGLIIVDLPPEEDKEFYNESEKNGLHVIRLITPTTDFKRLKKIAEHAKGFIYYVSVTGITGSKSGSEEDIKKKIKLIRSVTEIPIIIGFGIKSPKIGKIMSSLSDGIVVGSAIVENIKKNLKQKHYPEIILKKCLSFVKSFSL